MVLTRTGPENGSSEAELFFPFCKPKLDVQLKPWKILREDLQDQEQEVDQRMGRSLVQLVTLRFVTSRTLQVGLKTKSPDFKPPPGQTVCSSHPTSPKGTVLISWTGDPWRTFIWAFKQVLAPSLSYRFSRHLITCTQQQEKLLPALLTSHLTTTNICREELVDDLLRSQVGRTFRIKQS